MTRTLAAVLFAFLLGALVGLVALWRRSLRGWEPDPYAEPWGDV